MFAAIPMMSRRESGAPYGSDLITGTGGVQVYSSDDESGGDADLASNESQADSWLTGNYNTPTTRFWKVDLGPGLSGIVTKYEIDEFMSDGTGMASITFQGSNDDSAWTTLDTNTGPFVNNTKLTREFSNTTSFRYYRWVFTRTTLGNARVEIFRMFESI